MLYVLLKSFKVRAWWPPVPEIVIFPIAYEQGLIEVVQEKGS